MSFQNEAFATFCQARGSGFLDVARYLPHDPDLFVDPIHVNEEGARVRGWIVFNLLLPHIEAARRSGQLPKAPAKTDFTYGPIKVVDRPAAASNTPKPSESGPAPEPLPDFVALSRHEVASNDAHVRLVDGALHITTPATQWSRALRFPLAELPLAHAESTVTIDVRLNVLHGSVSIGLLRRDHPATYLNQIVTAAENEITVHLRVEPSALISHILVENALGGGECSNCEIISVSASTSP